MDLYNIDKWPNTPRYSSLLTTADLGSYREEAKNALLRETKRFEEAEALYRRALVIIQRNVGSEHPDMATCLNNLALLLASTNRLTEAETLSRRALAIDEKNLGADHPNVARDANNLAVVLWKTNRLSEAEPLSRRHLQILGAFSRRTRYEHPEFGTAVKNYTNLLADRGVSEVEIAASVRSAIEAKFDRKAGRNDPCPCGSGKKYKRCCGKVTVQ